MEFFEMHCKVTFHHLWHFWQQASCMWDISACPGMAVPKQKYFPPLLTSGICSYFKKETKCSSFYMFLYTCHIGIWTLLVGLSSNSTFKDLSKYLDYIVLKKFCKISKDLCIKSVSIHLQVKSDDWEFSV